MPQADPQACEDALALLKRVVGIDIALCPHISLGRWRTIEVLAPTGGNAASIDTAAHCRGPP